MPQVKKLNKVYTVPAEAVASYLKNGFDQINENGEVVKRATGGRNVPLPELNKALDENEALKAEVKKLKSENAKLKKGE